MRRGQPGVNAGPNPHFSPSVGLRDLGGVWAWHEHGVTMGGRLIEDCAQSWAFGKVCGGCGRCDLVVGRPNAHGLPRVAVAAVRCIIKSTDAMRQQRSTTGGAPRMFARTLRNSSRYG